MAKVALYSLDVIGTSMAGPGIRYWELAHALSKKHDVTLLIPNATDLSSEKIKIICYAKVLVNYRDYDVLITQKVSSVKIGLAKQHGLKIILDAYDPMPLENLEVFKAHPMAMRNIRNEQITSSFLSSFQLADAVICANDSQKDLWMGLLLSLKKIIPSTYDFDQNLKHLIDIVPFGLSNTPPVKTEAKSMRKLFGLKPDDKVLLWGGGIWNWFDPLSLIEAVHKLSLIRDDIKLVFMGLKHPNEGIPEMEMARSAVGHAKKYGLMDKHIFFNFGWVPYEERVNFLLEADIGVSTHFQHLETRYAFRTRILDYLWAGLPILCSRGDSFAELVDKHDLGRTVPVENSQAIVGAILDLMQKDIREKCKANIERIKPEFYWDQVAEPIFHMIDNFSSVPQKSRFALAKEMLLAGSFTTNPLLLFKRGIRACFR